MRVKIEEKEKQGNLLTFRVLVDEKDSSTSHEVAVDKAYSEKLGYRKPLKLVEKSFEYLLSREPKESILSKFNLREISRYFPEFEKNIQK